MKIHNLLKNPKDLPPVEVELIPVLRTSKPCFIK